MVSKMLSFLQEHLTVMSQLEVMGPAIEAIVSKMVTALSQGGKLFFMGNGGSASDAQHLAAEFIGRFKAERRALPAIALGTDTSILTALSNDYDYSIIFSRQLEALCQPADVVVGITTSGNSKNVLKGIETAKEIGAYTIGLTGGTGGRLINMVDLSLCVPSENVARIQEAHIFIGHTLCELVENKMIERSKIAVVV
jgi:D-sedoheptulose 7-phosphate isomerase